MQGNPFAKGGAIWGFNVDLITKLTIGVAGGVFAALQDAALDFVVLSDYYDTNKTQFGNFS